MPQHEIDSERLPYAPERLPRKPRVDADRFFSLDLRVGRVVSVEPFPEARDPAWKLEVDFGPTVGVLASSAKITNYSREDLLGRIVAGAVNLPVKRIAGFESQFLVLGALEPDGTVRLLELPEGVEPGAPIA